MKGAQLALTGGNGPQLSFISGHRLGRSAPGPATRRTLPSRCPVTFKLWNLPATWSSSSSLRRKVATTPTPRAARPAHSRRGPRGGLPVVSGAELVSALGKLGWVAVRQRGSHVRLRHPDNPAPWSCRYTGRSNVARSQGYSATQASLPRNCANSSKSSRPASCKCPTTARRNYPITPVRENSCENRSYCKAGHCWSMTGT